MTSQRTIAVWPHATKPEAARAAADFIAAVSARGLRCTVPPEDHTLLLDLGATTAEPLDEAGVELAVIFGGDGSILRAAEWALPHGVPLLGVNMGHVGFLAELEPSDFAELVDRVVARDYVVEHRLSIHADVLDAHGEVVWQSEAVNEVSVEKSARERMLEVMVSIDGLPLSRWGCDGVLVSTPTGSTAYAFSASGPVLWPDVEAMLVVPLSAHALFSRPVVLAPRSRVEMTLVANSSATGVVWADGRRTTELAPGSTVHITRGADPLQLARLTAQPFTSRLVRKFGLRVSGWRGEAEAGEA